MIDWDELIRREGSAVWRTAYRLVRNQADADECFQETFLAALELSNRQPVHNWPALLQRLATRRAIDRVRTRLRRRRLEEFADLALAEAVQTDPSQPAETVELSNVLCWCWHRFQFGKRTCFVCTSWRIGVISRLPIN